MRVRRYDFTLPFAATTGAVKDHERTSGPGGDVEVAPWTLAGGPDPNFDDPDRRVCHALLTDPDLAGRYRRRYGNRHPAGYEEMIRALGYVWDCSADGKVIVTGFRCPVCRRGRAAVLRA
jgi:hypothetical protein